MFFKRVTVHLVDGKTLSRLMSVEGAAIEPRTTPTTLELWAGSRPVLTVMTHALAYVEYGPVVVVEETKESEG